MLDLLLQSGESNGGRVEVEWRPPPDCEQAFARPPGRTQPGFPPSTLSRACVAVNTVRCLSSPRLSVVRRFQRIGRGGRRRRLLRDSRNSTSGEMQRSRDDAAFECRSRCDRVWFGSLLGRGTLRVPGCCGRQVGGGSLVCHARWLAGGEKEAGSSSKQGQEGPMTKAPTQQGSTVRQSSK